MPETLGIPMMATLEQAEAFYAGKSIETDSQPVDVEAVKNTGLENKSYDDKSEKPSGITTAELWNCRIEYENKPLNFDRVSVIGEAKWKSPASQKCWFKIILEARPMAFTVRSEFGTWTNPNDAYDDWK